MAGTGVTAITAEEKDFTAVRGEKVSTAGIGETDTTEGKAEATGTTAVIEMEAEAIMAEKVKEEKASTVVKEEADTMEGKGEADIMEGRGEADIMEGRIEVTGVELGETEEMDFTGATAEAIMGMKVGETGTTAAMAERDFTAETAAEKTTTRDRGRTTSRSLRSKEDY